jgi:chaperonin cofactor prefoldin
MTNQEAHDLRRENDYLKLRCATLEGDVADLSAQVARLQQSLEAGALRRAATAPNPLSGGQ